MFEGNHLTHSIHRLWIILALLFPFHVAAASGDIFITVTGEDSRPLSGVSITIESRSGEVHIANTDTSGTASVSGLNPGLFKITATRKGFYKVVEPSLRVIRDRINPLELQMRTADNTENVLVIVADALKSEPDGPVSATYLKGERLRTAAGSGADVLRALDGVPGLISTGDFANFTVRGRGPRDNLILVDGIPYDKVVHFDENVGEQEDINGGGRFSIFAPSLISGAEFSPGGWSARYGGRNGSLLKLDLAKGAPSPSASLRVDIAGLEFIYDGPSGIQEDTSLIFTARQFDFGRVFDLIDEKDIGNPVMTDVILKTHTNIDIDNTLEFLLLHTPETDERNVSHVLASENFESRELLDTEQKSNLLGINWTHLFGDDGQWENRFYMRRTDKTSQEGEAFPNSMPIVLPEDQVPVRKNILTQREDEKEIGWLSNLTFSNQFGKFSAGLSVSELDLDFSRTLADDWYRYEYNTTDFRADPSQRYLVLTPADTNAVLLRKEIEYAIYSEQVFEVGDWNFRAGLRYEYDGFSDDSYISPRLAINYHYSPLTRFSLTAGTFYQSPRFLERAADSMNNNLKNERVNHISAGFNYRLNKDWDLLAEIYYQQLDDLVTSPDVVTGETGNNGEGTSKGFDIVVNRRFNESWSANAVYSYNNATLDDRDGNGEYDADFNYEHFFTVGANWEIDDRWHFGFRWKYATGRPRDDFAIYQDVLASVGGPLRYSQEFTTNNTLRWDDFHTLNARLDYRRPFDSFDFIAFIDVLNVYGSSATDEREFNPITGELKEEEGETIPIIGIRFEKTWN
ncbi:TonB-dependent receptor [Aliikangiella coralliicola]|uniref:TonB-dependent receptor n=1 Tax=Aliikangiella coralliicola TaxID=2592383 RepID=UPI00143CEEF8|nr:TonB-dependent receptor [Aliikangiella coralliicola]